MKLLATDTRPEGATAAAAVAAPPPIESVVRAELKDAPRPVQLSLRKSSILLPADAAAMDASRPCCAVVCLFSDTEEEEEDSSSARRGGNEGLALPPPLLLLLPAAAADDDNGGEPALALEDGGGGAGGEDRLPNRRDMNPPPALAVLTAVRGEPCAEAVDIDSVDRPEAPTEVEVDAKAGGCPNVNLVDAAAGAPALVRVSCCGCGCC